MSTGGTIQASLPVGHLESTRLKVTQMMESIVALQRIVESGGQNVMPAWPDLLAKYNVLLSQSLNLTMSLVSGPASAQTQTQPQQQHRTDQDGAPTAVKPLAKLVLHPSAGLAPVKITRLSIKVAWENNCKIILMIDVVIVQSILLARALRSTFPLSY